MGGKRRRGPRAEPKTGCQEKKVKVEVVPNSICQKSVGKVNSQYLRQILVNFAPATFSYPHRIFLDKVRPDNVLPLVFFFTHLTKLE